MPQYLSPGVYVEEVPSGNKPIQGVGTSTGAFVGLAEKGPIGEPTLIGNRAEFFAKFGGFMPGAYLAYAVEQFFVNLGTRCFVVRTCGHDAFGNRLAAAAEETIVEEAPGTNNALQIAAQSPGAWGNALSVAIEHPWSTRTSGTTEDLADVHLTSRMTGLAVGANGTIRASTDGGRTWVARQTGTRSELLSVHFVNATNGTAVGEQGMILHTTDGGTRWVQQKSPTVATLNAVRFVSASDGWIVGDEGTILMTSDGGGTWTAQDSGTTAALRGLDLVNTAPTVGWAVGDGGTILRTDDSGTTWTPEASPVPFDLNGVSVSDAAADAGWAAGEGGTILRKASGGGWTEATVPAAADGDLLEIDFATGTTGCAVGEGGLILQTTDGDTWTVQNSTGPTLTSVSFAGANDGRAVGGGATVLTTADAGATWTAQAVGVTGADLLGVHFVAPTQGAAVGPDGTLLASDGTAWTAQQTSTAEDLAALSVIDARRHVAVGANGTVIVTTDGGISWTLRASGTTQALSDVFFVDSSTGWAVGAADTILVTSDGGDTWTAAAATGSGADLTCVAFANDRTGWVAGSGGTIAATTDGGATWTAQTVGTADFADLAVIGTTRGWVVGTAGALVVTTDGTTWTAQTSGTTEDLLAIWMADPQRGWIVGASGTVRRTTDGTTWTAQTSGRTASGTFPDLTAVGFFDPNVGWLVGAGGAVQTTSRGGVGSASEFDLEVFWRGESVARHERLVLDPDDDRSAAFVVNGASRHVTVTVDPDGVGTPGAPLRRPRVTPRIALTGGDDGTAAIAGTDMTGPDGLQAFDAIDDINIVAIPDSARRDVMLAGLAYCERRQDCFFVAHAPEDIDTALEGLNYKQAIGPEFAGQTGFNSSFGALYLTWIQVPDPLTGKTTFTPPVGAVVGRYSATDVRRGVHKVAAGIEDGLMRGVLGLKRQLSRAEVEILNPSNVNTLRMVDGVGNVVWGARTLSADPELRYVNTRRLLLFIEESIDEGTQWVVFEPNEQNLWAKIERNVKAFLRIVWRTGALFGDTEDKAFFVRCNAETNPPDSIELGRVVTEIGLAIVKPAEFVIFRISQSKAGAEISE